MQSGISNGRIFIKLLVVFFVMVIMFRVGIISGVFVGGAFLFVFGMIMAANQMRDQFSNRAKHTGSIEDLLKQKNDDLFYEDDDEEALYKHKNN